MIPQFYKHFVPLGLKTTIQNQNLCEAILDRFCREGHALLLNLSRYCSKPPSGDAASQGQRESLGGLSRSFRSFCEFLSMS